MQKRRAIMASFVAVIVVIAIVSYEFFVANSLSTYTKITVPPYQTPLITSRPP